MRQHCQDRRFCSIRPGPNTMEDSCPKQQKYLQIKYRCKGDQSFVFENVVLRQNSNCQHLAKQSATEATDMNRGSSICFRKSYRKPHFTDASLHGTGHVWLQTEGYMQVQDLCSTRGMVPVIFCVFHSTKIEQSQFNHLNLRRLMNCSQRQCWSSLFQV